MKYNHRLHVCTSIPQSQTLFCLPPAPLENNYASVEACMAVARVDDAMHCFSTFCATFWRWRRRRRSIRAQVSASMPASPTYHHASRSTSVPGSLQLSTKVIYDVLFSQNVPNLFWNMLVVLAVTTKLGRLFPISLVVKQSTVDLCMHLQEPICVCMSCLGTLRLLVRSLRVHFFAFSLRRSVVN